MNVNERKQCYFCTAGRGVVDYKDTETLRRFLSGLAKIYPRRKSGLCAKHQRRLAEAVKRARYLALLPFTNR
ncbi:MAG: 30S ribosomal protein S18 [Candidatus Sungbacteria bacterium]|nr:30S ribosomal protein S18 [Candidatus Sungbacteria bacterium]